MNDWIAKTERVFELLGKIPADIHAIVLVAAGVLLCICNRKEEGQSLIVGGAAIFKGQSK
jgi:hypothetical protein